MHDAFSRSFGLIIAFLLPGLVGLVAVGIYHPLVANWLSTTPTTEPTVGGFLYVVLGSLAERVFVMTPSSSPFSSITGPPAVPCFSSLFAERRSIDGHSIEAFASNHSPW